MEKKYELTDQTIVRYGHTLHAIRALRDVGGIKKGTLGGWIEKEANLSHEGEAWVFPGAYVYDNAVVSDDALVSEGAEVLDHAHIYQKAKIYLNARVEGNAKVYGNAQVYFMATVTDQAEVFDTAQVYFFSTVSEQAKICGTAKAVGGGTIKGNAFLSRKTDLFIMNNVEEGKCANVSAVFYLCADNRIRANVEGSFYGLLDEFFGYVDTTHGKSVYAKLYYMAAQLAKAQIAGGYRIARQKAKKAAS